MRTLRIKSVLFTVFVYVTIFGCGGECSGWDFDKPELSDISIYATGDRDYPYLNDFYVSVCGGEIKLLAFNTGCEMPDSVFNRKYPQFADNVKTVYYAASGIGTAVSVEEYNNLSRDEQKLIDEERINAKNIIFDIRGMRNFLSKYYIDTHGGIRKLVIVEIQHGQYVESESEQN